MTAMRTFISDYLQDPSRAVADAHLNVYNKFWFDDFSEDRIYAELSSPEFRLYEEMILCEDEEPLARDFAVA